VESQLTSTGQIFELAAANITIDGFAFPNLGLRGIDNSSTDANSVTIENNIILSTAGNCAGGGIIQFGGGYTANDFIFDQNYVVQNNSSECGSVLYMGDAMDSGTISNNYINASGVTFGPFPAPTAPAGWMIEGNELNGTLSGHGDYWGFGFNAQFGNVIIQNNYVHKMYIGLGQISVVGGTVSGNTFDDNQYAAFQLWGGEYGTPVSGNVTIQNNLIEYNGVTCSSASDASHGVRLRPTDYLSGPAPTDDPNGIDATTIHFHENSFKDLGVGLCGQAWAIRNNAGPGPTPTTLADATNNWWGQGTGPLAAQTDGYEVTSPYIAAYTDDPTKTPPTYYGFWPLLTPTFTFNLSSLPPKQYGVDTSFSVAAYAATNSPGAVTFAPGPASVGCTVTSDGTVTVTGPAVGASFCVIEASLAASGTYVAAGPISQSFHIAAASLVPTQYLVTVSPNSPVAGSRVTVTAQLANAVGSPVALANVIVTWSKTGTGGSFSEFQSKTNSSGKASILFTTSTVAGVTYTVAAKDQASRTGTSANFTTVAGPVRRLVLDPLTASQPVNSGQTYTVTGFDEYNNPLGDVTASTSFAIVGGACSVNVCRSAVTGKHTVTGTDGAAKGTATLTVTAGPPDHLAFGQQPTNVNVNAAISPAVTVKILDLFGNLVDVSSTISITVDLGSNPTGATLSGTLIVPAVHGVATFNNLKLNKAGTMYTLGASSAPLFGSTSAKFNVVNPPTGKGGHH
jgi:hypothetical protein